MEAVSMKAVEKRFGDRRVLRGLNLSVGQGEVYGLLGNNGAGKSTAINILTGLLEADQGTVTINGRSPDRSSLSDIGVAPQEIALYPTLTCRENLRFFAGVNRLRGQRRRDRVAEIINLLELQEYASTTVSKLSGGWQRRLNLALAIVHSPSLLILDEPTAGLDIQARYKLWEFIEQLRNTGVTILITTHILEEAEVLCNQIGILHDGRIVCHGSVERLLAGIPAVEMAEIETEDESALLSRTEALGISVRRYGGRLTLLLSSRTTLSDLIAQFDGVPIRSATLKPVGLQHVFLDAALSDQSADYSDLSDTTGLAVAARIDW